MDAPCNLQESIHVLVTKYLFVSSFWGTHHFFGRPGFLPVFFTARRSEVFNAKKFGWIKGNL